MAYKCRSVHWFLLLGTEKAKYEPVWMNKEVFSLHLEAGPGPESQQGKTRVLPCSLMGMCSFPLPEEPCLSGILLTSYEFIEINPNCDTEFPPQNQELDGINSEVSDLLFSHPKGVAQFI